MQDKFESDRELLPTADGELGPSIVDSPGPRPDADFNADVQNTEFELGPRGPQHYIKPIQGHYTRRVADAGAGMPSDDPELDALFADDSRANDNLPDLWAEPESPTLQSLKQDGKIDDLIGMDAINARTEVLDRITRLRDGALGEFGVADPGEATQKVLEQIQQELDENDGKWGALDVVSAFPGLWQIAKAAYSGKYPGQPGLNILSEAGKQVMENRTVSDRKKRELLEYSRQHPEYGVTTRDLAGTTRANVDAVAQTLADVPAAMIESVGIGASIAGWGVGATDSIEDNSFQAVGRYARAVAKTYFPGDPVRQEDFSVNFAKGIASTAGFWGLQSAAVALKMAKPGSVYLLATIGAMQNAPGGYREALDARAAGRDVSDLQLALTFAGGLALGATEAWPIARNLPIALKSGSNYAAYAQTILREMGEEGGQEWFQSYGMDLLAKGLYDPNRRIGEDAGRNALIGALSGGGITALRLATSPGARQESIQEARLGRPNNSGGVDTRPPGDAPGDAPQAQPQGKATPPPPKQPPAPVTEFNLDQYDESAYPQAEAAPQFDSDLAGYGGPAWPTAGPGAAPRDETPVPSYKDVIETLKSQGRVDDQGGVDVSAFQDEIEGLTGKRYWNQLSDQEKVIAFEVASGQVDIADVQAAAATGAPVESAGAVAPQDDTSPTGSQQQAPAGGLVQGAEIATASPPAGAGAKAATRIEQPNPDAEARRLYSQSGVDHGEVSAAMRIPTKISDPATKEALELVDIELSVDAVDADGTSEQQVVTMPAAQALTMIDKRLNGVNQLLRCMGI